MEEVDTFAYIKKKKKKCLSCGKINKYFIFPFLSPIFIFIRDVLLHQAQMKTIGLRKILQYELYDGIMHSSCILLYIIESIRIRKGKEEKKKIENIVLQQMSRKKKKPDRFKIFFIILTIGFALNNYISTKMLSESDTIFEIRIYHVIFNAIFCKFILGYKVHKHQLLSIISILVGWVLISIPIYVKLKVYDIYWNLIYLLFAIFYPFYLALLKYLIEKYFESVSLYMFFIGVTLIIISITLNIVNSFINYSNFSDVINIFDFAYNKLLFFFAFVSGAIVKFILCIIIEHFSPNIFILTNVISSLIAWVYDVSYKKPKIEGGLNIMYYIFLSIGYFIILISCLIYNEIIILNFCNMSENTNAIIKDRLEIDEQLSEFDSEERNYEDIGGYYISNRKSERPSSSSIISIDTNKYIELPNI